MRLEKYAPLLKCPLGICNATLKQLFRLAKKKAQAEAMKREMEAAQRKEEERLLAKHKVMTLTRY